ncbi:MAG: alpha/beta fold hydrolase, partial [Thermomicrobium sp.]
MTVSEFVVQAGRLPTHLYRAGQGHPVLFLHGSGPGVTAWANWRFAVPALADQFDCIAPDLWGFA